MGCIDLPAVLEPLDFLLPERETLAPPTAPELDVTAELDSLTFETQLKDPLTEPDLTVEAGRPDPAPTPSGLRESESEPTESRSEEQDEETLQDEEFSLE